MGYFFRRSARLGPIRLNLSQSGVGASVGVKGARLTMTSRGTTYVTIGSHGFYYRETLENRRAGSEGQFRHASPPPVASDPSDQIRTADASDLVDSSSEVLVSRLNERANMFNPAWLIFIASAGAFFGALYAFADGQASSGFSAVTDHHSEDDYAFVVSHYGYPDSVRASEPLGMVRVRTAEFAPVHTQVVFVQNECVSAYEETMEAVNEKLHRSERVPRIGTPCKPAPDSVWKIVRYIDTTRGTLLSPDIAKINLGVLPNRNTSPPLIEVEIPPINRPKSKQPTVTKKQLDRKPQIQWTAQIQVNREPSERPTKFTGISFLIASGGLFVCGIIAQKRNSENRLTRLFYELGDSEQQKHAIVQQALAHLGKSQLLWRIDSDMVTSDWKRNAGARSLVQRRAATVTDELPPRVLTNVSTPCLNLGSVRLFFMPDIVLYWQGGTFGTVPYSDLSINHSVTDFIEDGWVPSDATVVGHTWRYVNKDGGPDRRFNDNLQLPVVQYGVLVLLSSRGLNICLNTSNAQESLAVAQCWSELQTRIKGKQQATEQNAADRPCGPIANALKMMGLSDTASWEEVNCAYRRMVQLYHPDKVAGLAPEFQEIAERRMKEINAAYETLKSRGN
jgi:hypothetical protein